jgi:hypothetical protein
VLTSDVLVLAIDATNGKHAPGASSGAASSQRWRLLVLRVDDHGECGQAHSGPGGELWEWAAALHTSAEVATAPWL